VARRHAVNANQVFYWRKKYREGRLGKSPSSKRLPVTLSDISRSESGRSGCGSSPFAVGSMEIKLAKGTRDFHLTIVLSTVAWFMPKFFVFIDSPWSGALPAMSGLLILTCGLVRHRLHRRKM
jgi:hypothetical protein